jgi:hypothetical protein
MKYNMNLGDMLYQDAKDRDSWKQMLKHSNDMHNFKFINIYNYGLAYNQRSAFVFVNNWNKMIKLHA